MSFCSDIKKELEIKIPQARHCQLAELAGLYFFGGSYEKDTLFESENELVARKGFTLLKKTFNMKQDCLTSEEVDTVISVLSSDLIAQKACCKRAYLRGAFLGAGTVTNPEKSYHFEIMCPDEKRAHEIAEYFAAFEVEMKVVKRAKKYAVYIKDGSQIADALNVCEAHVAMMEYENARILKDMRNSVNRKVNCETANIGKTVTASVKQIDSIKMLMGTSSYKELPDKVRQMAELRIKYPNASLTELGELSDPPIGKSGVNHRLRKLNEAATLLKEENYDKERDNNPS